MKHLVTLIILFAAFFPLPLLAQADLHDTEKRKLGKGLPEQIIEYAKPLTIHTTTAAGGRIAWKTGSAPLLDRYICYGDSDDPIKFEIKIDQEVKDLKHVKLTLSVWDVDESSGEVDVVYVNGQNIGTLHGANDSWSVNFYDINPSILVGGTPANPGINTVTVDLTVEDWCVTVDWGEISADGGQLKIVEFVPGANKLSAFKAPDLRFKFSEELDEKTVSDATVKLQYRKATGDPVDVASTLTVAKEVLTIKPTGDLKDGVKFTITISGNGDGVKSKKGDTLAGPQKYDFATVPDLTPEGPGATEPGVFPIQVVRNEKQIREKPAVMRIYTNKWDKKADVHPSSQLEKIPVRVRLKDEANHDVASTEVDVERKDVRETQAKRKAGTNSANVFYDWGAALADGAHTIDVALEPKEQTATTPATFKKPAAIKMKAGKVLKVVYQYLLAEGWAGGVPQADRDRMERLMADCKTYFRDNFPVKDVEVTKAADIDVAAKLAPYTWPNARNFPAATRSSLVFLDTVKNILLDLDAWKNKGAGKAFVALIPLNFGRRSADSGWTKDIGYTGASYPLGLGGAAEDNQMIFLRDDGGTANQGANAATVAHEFGHNYSISTKNFNGTSHTQDAMDTEGYWVTKKLNKSTTEGNSEANAQKSLMAVQIQPVNEQWICDYDYNELFDNVPSTLIRKTPSAAANHLFIAGGYDLRDQFYLSPVWESEHVASSYPNQGDHTLILLSRSGAEIAAYQFPATSIRYGDGTTETLKSFVFFVPSPADLGSLRIKKGSTILKAITRSTHAPTVTITSPAAGAVWRGTQRLTWSGTDADKEKLLYTVRYSSDAGDTWLSLAANYEGTSLDIATGQLPSGRNCILRVSATDGTLNYASNDVALSVDNGLALGLFSPSNNSVNVGVGARIEASFMTPVAEANVTPSVFTLKETYTGKRVEGMLQYSAASKTVTFVPARNLQYSTKYTASIKSGITDASGIRLASDTEWSFTTRADSSDLTIRLLDPLPSSSGSPVNGTIAAVFNKPLNGATVTSTSFTLYDNTAKTAVPGSVSYNAASNSAILTPQSALKPQNDYRVTLTTAIRSADNKALAEAYEYFFVTGSDSIAGVHLRGTYGETGIDDNNDRLYDWLAIDVDVSVVDAGTYSINGKLADKDNNEIVWATANNQYLNKGVTTIRLKFDGRIINAYKIDGPYYLNDLQIYNTSNTNKSDWTSSAYVTKAYTYRDFQTSTIPVVMSFTPDDGATGVPTDARVTAVFTRAMSPASIDSTTFYVVDRTNVRVRGAIAYDTASYTAAFTPAEQFKPDSVYRAAVTTNVMDMSGTRLLKQYNWSFTIASTASTASGGIGELYTYPNPFPHSSLPQGGMYFTYVLETGGGNVRIRIYTITGDLVKEIGESTAGTVRGFNQVYWNGKNEAGKALANGTYLYMIHYTDGAGSEHKERGKFTVLKGE